jgi:hypothetical protein
MSHSVAVQAEHKHDEEFQDWNQTVLIAAMGNDLDQSQNKKLNRYQKQLLLGPNDWQAPLTSNQLRSFKSLYVMAVPPKYAASMRKRAGAALVNALLQFIEPVERDAHLLSRNLHSTDVGYIERRQKLLAIGSNVVRVKPCIQRQSFDR